MVTTSRASMPNYAKRSMNGFDCLKPKAGHFPDQPLCVRSKRLSEPPTPRRLFRIALPPGARRAIEVVNTRDPKVMGGKPCIRGMRITVGTIVGLIASGHSHAEVLRLYPYLEEQDIQAALSYAAWRTEELELPIGSA